MITIETGDTVFHRPSRETWTVAYARDNLLCSCGWPLTQSLTGDCLLVSKAMRDEKLALIRALAAIQNKDDPRKSFAIWALENYHVRGFV